MKSVNNLIAHKYYARIARRPVENSSLSRGDFGVYLKADNHQDARQKIEKIYSTKDYMVVGLKSIN